MPKKIIFIGVSLLVTGLLAGGLGGLLSPAGESRGDLLMAAEIGGRGAAGKQERSTEEATLLTKIKDLHARLTEEPLSYGLITEMDRDYAQLFASLPATDAADVLRLNFQEDTLRRLDARARDSFRVLVRQLQSPASTTSADKKALSEEKNRLATTLSSMFNAVKVIPRMQAVMTVGSTGGSVPLSVELSAIGSSDPKKRTIAPQSFRWSYVDHDRILRDLGTGVEKVVTFDHPGVYVVRLTVESSLDKTVLPGVASSPEIRINPPETAADFSINGFRVPANGTVEVSVTDARKGLKFDPTLSAVAAEREITLYEWSINGKRQSFTTPETVIEKFDLTTAKGGSDSLQQLLGSSTDKAPSEQTVEVVLRVTDNIGKSNTKRVRLAIRKSIAIIKATSQGQNGKREFRTNIPIRFDGSSSAVENTPSTQYTWQLTGPDNFQKSFFEQSFDFMFEVPGEYVMELMVGNGFKTKETYLVLPQPPPAIFSWKQNSPSQPGVIRFDASESRDVRGRQLSFSWDFDGNGEYEIQSSAKQIISWNYDRIGSHLVKLAVTDEFGETSISEEMVSIASVLNVDFTADTFAVQPGKEIVFRAEAPSAVRFSWDFGDGIIKETEQASMPYSYPVPGRKEVVLTAFDAAGNANTITKGVVVGDGKSPVPQVRATVSGETISFVKNLCGPGKDALSVFRNQVVQLDAAESVNARGEKTGLRFSWDFQDGTVITEPLVTKKFSELSGSSRCSKVVLAVQDTATGTSTAADEILVYVENAAPSLTQLQINANQRCDTPCTAGLKAIGGWDPDGEVMKYRWWAYREGNPEKIGVTMTDEPEATLIIPARGAKNEENTYYFVVELTDDTGKSITSEEIFGHRSEPRTVINVDNPKPTIDFSISRPLIYTGEEAVFTAEAKDPESEGTSASAYAWDFDGDGTYDDTNSGPSAAHTFTAPGKYLVVLRLRIRGIEVVKEHEISVIDKPAFPHPSFFYTREGMSVTFDGSESQFDPEIPGNKLFYFWDFDASIDSNNNGIPNDDPEANGETVIHEFPKPGVFPVQLSVTDIQGVTNSTEQLVEVGAGAEPKPAALLPIFRSPRLLFGIPAASLDLLAKKIASDTGNTFDIIVFGRDLNGAPMSGLPRLRLKDGTGDILFPFTPFEDGFSIARISLPGDAPPIIEVTADTLISTITESLLLPKNSLLPI